MIYFDIYFPDDDSTADGPHVDQEFPLEYPPQHYSKDLFRIRFEIQNYAEDDSLQPWSHLEDCELLHI